VTSIALAQDHHYSGSPFSRLRDEAVTCRRHLLSIVIGKEIAMSSKQHRNLQAGPADSEALESLQHMTTWARQTVTSPEASPPLSRLGGLVDHFALGATAFYSGPWSHPIDLVGEAGMAPEAEPRQPSLAARAGQAAVRFWHYVRERRATARATDQLSRMDDRALQDIGLTRADIGRAARYGRDWERWR
jgi:uncharacterized protein YjiS (DUF1127 family)